MNKVFRFWWQAIRRWLREPRIVWRSETSALQTTIEVQQWAPFVVFLVTLIWYLAAPSPVVLMSTVCVGGMTAGSWLWARSMARGVRGQRHLRFAAMQVGDELEEQISLQNRTWLPVLWAEFVDRSEIPGYTVSSARAAGGQSRIEWRAHTICTRRGVFSLGPWELSLGEPLGIFKVRQRYLQHQEILVYPPLAALPEHILPHRGAVGDHLPLNQPLRAATIASSGVRAYSPGDPLRHLHWRTTARRSEPFVKVFAPEAASNVWLVPDFDASVHYEGPNGESSQETMVTVVASLAAELLRQNLAVGLLASAKDETVVLPRQGQAYLWTVLQALAPLTAAHDRPIGAVLERAQGLISGRDLLVLVTPSLRPDWAAALRRVARSRVSGGRGEVILLDPASFGAPQGETSATAFLTLLLEQGIRAHLLRREDVRLISGYYGEVSRWEFSVVGTGRAVAKKSPRAAVLMAASGAAPLSDDSARPDILRKGDA